VKKIALMISALVLVVSGVAAVSAYESHIVNVQAHVENALTVPQDEVNFGTVFPEEFLVKQITIELSDSFKNNQTRVSNVTYDVYVHCKDGTLYPDVEWMGDAAYMAGTDPGTTLPGGGAAGNDPALGTPNAPWFRVGGDPNNCPGSPGNLMNVLSGVNINKANPVAGAWVGLDVPVCDFNYNPDTDVKPKPSGYDEPTVVLITGDPRWESQDVDRECEYDIGMDVKFQVTNIGP
jgi:hypothetical protein